MFAVAGVTGNTGALVARRLLAAGHAVRVIVRRAEAAAPWRAVGAEVALADLADPRALAAAVAEADGAYLLNPPSYTSGAPFADAHRVGEAFASALAAARPARAVVLSSVGAHHREGTGIIRSTHEVEAALAHAPVPVTFLRASYFAENWSHVLPVVEAQGVLPSFLAPLDRRVPMNPVTDIADAAVRLLTGPAWSGVRAVELASFVASPAEVAAALGQVRGRPVSAVAVPREQWTALLAGNGFSPAIVAAFVAMYDGINAGVVAAEEGREAIRGSTTLAQAAAALLAPAAVAA